MTAPAARRGFTEAAVVEMAERRGEPEWLRDRRMAAWQTFLALPMPTRQDEEWRRTDLRSVHLDEVSLEPVQSAVAEQMVAEAGGRENLAGYLGLADGHVAIHAFDERLAGEGVIFTDLMTAIREHPDLIQAHLMTRCVHPGDNKFAALHAAFWDNGTFLYVPRGVTVEQPFRVTVAATPDGTASLAHTLVVIGEGARATLAQEFVSSVPRETGLAAGFLNSFCSRAPR